MDDPTTPTERRRVPAGHAIAVVTLALLLAAFFDADSLVASIEQQPFGTSRSVGLVLARPVRRASDWTRLNRPRMWLDEILHGSPGHAVPIAVPSPPVPLPLSPPAAGRPGPSTTTTSIPLVTRRLVSATHPLKVWMAGDSLMGTIAESFADLTKTNSAFNVTDDVQIGTGLARPDVYDWGSAVSQELAKDNPDVVIFMFGANDDQDMQVNGHRVVRGTDAWRVAYSQRVSQLLALTATGNRQVIWLGLPAVVRPRLNQTKDVMNAVIRAVTAQYAGATFVDTGPIFDTPSGGFTTYVAGTGGQPVKVRESDGIHFTLAGSNRLTPQLLADIDKAWALKS